MTELTPPSSYCVSEKSASPSSRNTLLRERSRDSVVNEDSFLIRGGRPGSGFLATFWNTTKMSVGIGMLSFPYGFQKAGYGAASATLLFTAALTISSVSTLVFAQKRAKARLKANRVSYIDTVRVLLGDYWGHVAAAAILLSQTGASIGYEIFICNTFEAYFDILSYNSWLLVLQLPLLISCALRSLQSLSIISFVGLVCLWLSIASSMWLMVGNAEDHGWALMKPFTSLSDYRLFVGLAALSFEGLASVALTIQESMANPEQFMHVAVLAIVLLTVLELTFALLGCFAFGAHANEVITRSFVPGRWATVTSVLFSLELLCTFSGAMFPVWLFGEEALFGKSTEEVQVSRAPSALSCIIRTLFRSLIVLLMAGVALLFRDNFAVFLSLLGNFSCTAVVFIIPARLSLEVRQPLTGSWILGMLLLLVGIGVMLSGLLTTFGL